MYLSSLTLALLVFGNIAIFVFAWWWMGRDALHRVHHVVEHAKWFFTAVHNSLIEAINDCVDKDVADRIWDAAARHAAKHPEITVERADGEPVITTIKEF